MVILVSSFKYVTDLIFFFFWSVFSTAKKKSYGKFFGSFGSFLLYSGHSSASVCLIAFLIGGLDAKKKKLKGTREEFFFLKLSLL